MLGENELVVKEQQNKNYSGVKTNESVESMLGELVANKLFNISVEKDYSQGYPDKEKQFKMDYCVTFHDYNDIQWLLKSTSSIRDRIHGTEFFAQNIRIIDSDTSRVDKIYVVVPDSLSAKEQANARRYSEKINSSTYVSFLSDVVTINELRYLIIDKCIANAPQGIRSNIIGMDAEKRIALLLKDKKNWQLWNNFELYKHEVKSDTFQWFDVILSGIGCIHSIDSNESEDPIKEIEATDKIASLKGGGPPKTDVSFILTTKHRNKEMHNISIKRTDEKLVTVHEGDVTDIIRALKIPNNQLATALLAFQKYGSMKQLQDSGNITDIDVLNRELPQYNRALIEFAFFGVNSHRAIYPAQVADCILYFDSTPSKDCFWTRDAFVEHYLNQFETKGNFGTPFQWTYPSKKRGTRIQLKGYTNN